MNPVVGLDVAKGESQVQAFLDKGKPYRKRGIQLLNLRNLTRQQESIAEMAAKTKLQLHSLIDQVFPEFRGVFGSLYSKVSLLTLLAFPTSESVLSVDEKELTEKISSLCNSRSEKWANERAQKLREAALRNPFQHNQYESHIFNLEMLINIVLQYQEHLSKLANEIDSIAKEIEEYKILQSIPGIGEKIAATIISEIGEIDRFDAAKKLVAFAGVDPSVYSSGKFTASINKITKRGSSRLRHALYMAIQSGIRDARKKKITDEIIPRNKRLREFYDKKREEGKPFRVAIIACVNKLLHWIYALLKNRTAFQDIA